uniref:5-formyltetrahydrofolate cyclo-ligase n=1 Tax=Cacopsylla melanoneura TaxID=428564 RepID=A0A8D8QHQ4_9HEMI
MLILSSYSDSNKVTSGLVCVCLVLIFILIDHVDSVPRPNDKVLCPVCNKVLTRRRMSTHLDRVHPLYHYNDFKIAHLETVDAGQMGSVEVARELNSEETRLLQEQIRRDGLLPTTTKRFSILDDLYGVKTEKPGVVASTRKVIIPRGREHLRPYKFRTSAKGFVSKDFIRKKEEEKEDFLKLQKVWYRKLRQIEAKKRPKVDDGFDAIEETFRNSLNDKETTTLFDEIRDRHDAILPMRKFSLQQYAASNEDSSDIDESSEFYSVRKLKTTVTTSTEAPNIQTYFQPDPTVAAPTPIPVQEWQDLQIDSSKINKGPRLGKEKVACPHCGGLYSQRGLKRHMKSAHPDAGIPSVTAAIRPGLSQPPVPPPPRITQPPPPKQLDLYYRFVHQRGRNTSVPRYTKLKLRSSIDKLIKMMPREHKKLESAMVRGRLLNHPEYKNAKRIAIYISKNDEIDTLQLLDDICSNRKKVCYTPWYQNLFGPDMRMLRLFHPDDMKMFKKTKEGILVYEKPWLSRDALKTEGGLDLIIVPGRVFTMEGKRLGRHGDLYDAFLHAAKKVSPHCKTIGLAFGKQIVDDFTVHELVDPNEPRPVCMDYILYDLNFKRLVALNGQTPIAPTPYIDDEMDDQDFYDEYDEDEEEAAKHQAEYAKNYMDRDVPRGPHHN